MRILTGGIHEESNSFSPLICRRDRCVIVPREKLVESFRGGRAMTSGTIAALEEAGCEIIPTYEFTSASAGPVADELVKEFLDIITEDIQANLPLDGIFLSLHGATQMESDDDACGYILTEIRKLVGPGVVITAGTDMHANITDRMIEAADYISGYQTYPHDDFFSTGYRAAKQGLAILQGQPVVQARVRIPMIVPAESYNTNEGAFKALIDEAHALVAEGKILDFSIYQMQPWLDVADAGSTVLVSAADKQTAAFYARQLANELFELRKTMTIQLYSIDEVIDAAKANTTEMPVVLVDSADSPNAGSCADSSYVLNRLLERGETIPTCICVADAPAAKHAFELGVGATGEFTLGGTKDPGFQTSVKVTAYVKSLHDGKYRITSSQGLPQDVGPTAVLQIGSIDCVVYSVMKGSSDPRTYRAFGLEPAMYRLVMVKSATQYKLQYSQFSTLFYPTDTPGASSANLEKMPFCKVPRPFHPLDKLDTFDDTVTYVHE